MKQRLADLAVIRSGYQFRGGVKDETPDATPVRVIQIKDVEGGTLAPDGLERARPRKDVADYAIEIGDVLLLGRGRHFGATLVDVPLEEPTIAVQFFWILRPHPPRPQRPSLVPAYLAWLLNHPTTQNALAMLANSGHIPFISRSVVEELEVDVPPLQTQLQIARLDQLHRREQQLTQQLTQTRAQWMDALTLQLARQNQTP